MANENFRFNKELLDRFVSIAQPYFFPLNAPNPSLRLIVLLVSSILFVMSICYFGIISIGAIIQYYSENLLLVALTEKRTKDEIDNYIKLFSEVNNG